MGKNLIYHNLMGAEEFDYAKDRVWDLPRTPDNNELLELYKLYIHAMTMLRLATNKQQRGTATLIDQGVGI
jgi:acyl-CoA-binding protein